MTEAAPEARVEARDAEHGKKMIELRVRFFTDALAPEGQIYPKHGWTSGVVRVSPNDLHGITSIDHPIIFNTWSELLPSIERALIKAGIKLVPAGRQKKYLAALLPGF